MGGALEVIWHGLRDSLLMAWAVWWALVLGFAISAIVQAWVPRERIERTLSGSGARPRGACHRSRRGLLLVLLRRCRDRPLAVREGCLLRHGARVSVRLHQPRLGARSRAVGTDRLAVHARRVPRRDRDDRADGSADRAASFPPGWKRCAQARAECPDRRATIIIITTPGATTTPPRIPIPPRIPTTRRVPTQQRAPTSGRAPYP